MTPTSTGGEQETSLEEQGQTSPFSKAQKESADSMNQRSLA